MEFQELVVGIEDCSDARHLWREAQLSPSLSLCWSIFDGCCYKLLGVRKGSPEGKLPASNLWPWVLQLIFWAACWSWQATFTSFWLEIGFELQFFSEAWKQIRSWWWGLLHFHPLSNKEEKWFLAGGLQNVSDRMDPSLRLYLTVTCLASVATSEWPWFLLWAADLPSVSIVAAVLMAVWKFSSDTSARVVLARLHDARKACF